MGLSAFTLQVSPGLEFGCVHLSLQKQAKQGVNGAIHFPLTRQLLHQTRALAMGLSPRWSANHSAIACCGRFMKATKAGFANHVFAAIIGDYANRLHSASHDRLSGAIFLD
jgi:hypothetical protein